MNILDNVSKSKIVLFAFIISVAFGLSIIDNQHTENEKAKLKQKIKHQREIIDGVTKKYWKAVRKRCEMESI